MNDILLTLFGEGKDLTTLQICVRAFLMFFIALALVRLGVRIFSKKSAFDDIVSVMLGALLSRGVTGAAPFGSVVAAGAVLVAVHRGVAYLCIKNKSISHLLKGKQIVLFNNGRINEKNLTVCSLSKSDLMESLRLSTNKDSLEEVEAAYMENNGSVSFVLKKGAS